MPRGLYVRVTLDGKAPLYEAMHDRMKICDMSFEDIADTAVFMIDLLTEKKDSYEIRIGGKEMKLDWQGLFHAVEQFTGALRFEAVTSPYGKP